MANVAPGDLTRIVHPSLYGKFVNVLYETPVGESRMPDGQLHLHIETSPHWVCEAHGERFNAPLMCGAFRKTRYGSIGDKWLRPVRDSDGEDEILTLVGKPEAVTA